MGDEHVAQLGETDTATAQLHLSTLGTVDHENLLTHLHNL